jgi:hypothetical protein
LADQSGVRAEHPVSFMADKDKATGRFLPGNSGFTGRPKGSRNKLGEEFIQALYADFTAHGEGAIVQVREERPHEYLKVVAGLLPKELRIERNDMTDEQIIERIRQIDEALGLGFGIAQGKAGSGADDEAPSGSNQAPPVSTLQ